MAKIPETMRAWVTIRPGSAKDVLKLKTDWPVPAAPGTGEIMIRVSYVPLNLGDTKMLKAKIPPKGARIAGLDFIGEVVQVGPANPKTPSALRVGMVVAGVVSFGMLQRGDGTLVDYLVVPSDAVAEKPDGLEEYTAGGLLGVAGQTSVTLLDAAKLRKGDRVLLNGASGGVGCIMIQVLRAMGVHVTGVCSAKNETLVRRLGAEEVVDYTAHTDLPGYLSSLTTAGDIPPFDVIIDCVGNDALYRRSTPYLKSDGRYLSIEAGPYGYYKIDNWWPAILGGTPRTFIPVFSHPSGLKSAEAGSWFTKGWIKEFPVDSIFGMDDALQAFEKLATNRTVGKIYVKVK